MLWLVLAACVLLGVPVLLALLIPDDGPDNATVHEQERPAPKPDRAEFAEAA